MPTRLHVFGAPVDNLTVEQAALRAVELASGSKPELMSTLNTDILRHYHARPDFAEVFDSAALITMDGAPLFKLARRLGSPIQAKVSGPDLMPEVCREAAARGLTCYLLGGAPGVPSAAAAKLVERFPGLVFSGAVSPAYGFADDEGASRDVVHAVRAAAPDILFICLGTPRSEMWWARWKEELGVPFSMSLGAAVDFMAGSVKRAPAWMSEAGLEWLWRTTREPGRLARRYVSDAAFLVSMLGRRDLRTQMRFEGLES